MRRGILLVLALLPWLGACSSPGPAPNVATAQDTAPSEVLQGQVWSLVQIQSMDDTLYTPARDGQFTLQFLADGRLLVRADCNRGSGRWQLEPPSGLRLGPIAVTKMSCGEASIDARFLGDLGYVRGFLLRDGALYLTTLADGSILQFRPLAP